MAREFKSANLYEIQDIIAAYPFSRRITEVHLHHTWRPRQSDYRGLATIEGMWRYHTENNGWSDIGQHITVAPDGDIWLCRNFNWAPASARGFNGNRSAGPFMIEMIGDFDEGEEGISCEQHDATLAVIKSVQEKFGLGPEAIRFHNEMSEKSCPGTGNDKADWIGRIERFTLRRHRAGSRDMPFPSRYTRAYELMRGMNPDAEQTDDMSDSEHDDNLTVEEDYSRSTSSEVGSSGRDSDSPLADSRSGSRELNVDLLESLSGHVVNIERGRFSDSGRLETTEQDVDRIFEELLPQEIANARAQNRKAHVLFYAHGGLVSERNALLGASKQLDFWHANGVYPVFFIWETGVAETIRQLVTDSASRTQPITSRGAMDWFTDNVTDPIIEDLARASGGALIWSGMKSSAALASQTGKAAHYVAMKAAELFSNHEGEVDIHVVGHSAGSIFHTHFMPQLIAERVEIRTAHFLAPAVRNDLFRRHIAPLLGEGLGPLTVFTMNKQREKADSVASLYHKSLLYLVSRAFEDETDADILGLEESLRRDRETRALFGLDGTSSSLAEVVWSPTPESKSGHGSTATAHGGFDDDPATMESVLRRMLGLRNGEDISPFPIDSSRDATDPWQDQFDWPESLAYLSRLNQSVALSGLTDTFTGGPSDKPGTVTIAGVAGSATTGGAGAEISKNFGSETPVDEDEAGDARPDKWTDSEGKATVKNKKNKKDKKVKKKELKGKKAKSGKKEKSLTDKNAKRPPREDRQDLHESDLPQSPGYRALCIGIDTYRRSPLKGCVADARLWKNTLASLGYDVTLLENEQATASQIRAHVRQLVHSSAPGDNLVLQFAGHGTQFMDIDGDESEGDSPALDECLCAVDCDFSNDGLVIDDELRIILSDLPKDVSMTCFFDCCHSGSATRAALMMAGTSGGHDVRARFLVPSEHMEKAYGKRVRKVRSRASPALLKQRDVLFSACRSTELAYESDGQGDFTRRATGVIAEGIDGLSNVDFIERVLMAFGSSPRQNPEIHCDVSARHQAFLASGRSDGAKTTGIASGRSVNADLEES